MGVMGILLDYDMPVIQISNYHFLLEVIQILNL